MADFLKDRARNSAARASAARERHDEARLFALAECTSAPPPLVLQRRFEVIAEIKERSPAEGSLQSDLGRADRARAYADGGAAAVSVLTEPERFDGHLDHLAEVATVLAPYDVPAMRKDFLVDAYQVLEARVAGAGGVLLIVAMLPDAVLAAQLERAAELGLFVLLECFDTDDLVRARRLLESPVVADRVTAGQCLLGVNTRDLRTLAVDADRLERLAPELPADVPTLAESGLVEPADAARAAELGYRGALIGSALMRSADPGSQLAAFVAAGRGR